jgi:hypothetical protein
MGGVQRDVQKTHFLEVDFEDGAVGSQAGGHAGCVDPGHSAAENHHTPGQHAGDASQENAASTVVFAEKIASHQHGHSSGDFAHWFEEWEASVP